MSPHELKTEASDLSELRAEVAALRERNERQEELARRQSASLEDSQRQLRERTDQLVRFEHDLRDRTVVLESVLESMGEGVVVVDPQGRVLLCNPAAERILGADLKGLSAEERRERFQWMLGDEGAPCAAEAMPLARAMRGEEVTGAELFVRHAGCPEGVWLSINARALGDESGRPAGGVVVMRDVTEAVKAARRRGALHAVTRALSEAGTLAEAAPRVLAALGEGLGWDLGVLWSVDPGGKRLQAVDVWCRGGAEWDGAAVGWRGAVLAVGAGLAGQAAANRQSAWVPDAAAASGLGPVAARPELRCGLAAPAASASGAVTAVLEFWARQGCRPDEELQALYAAVGSQVGQFIERKRAEEEVRRIRERYDLAVRGSGDGLWDWDVQTNEVYFSPRWKSMLGYEEHEIAGEFEEWEKRIHPEDRERALVTVETYFNDPQAVNYELEHRLRNKDETYRWILARGVALRDAQGRPLRMAGSHTDISARKEMEQALRDSEALYHSLVETLPLNIFRKDLAGRFTFANRVFCRTLGRPLPEIRGKTDHDFYPRALAEKYRSDDMKVMATREVFEATEEHLRPTGDKIYVQVLKTPVYDARGEVVGIQGIFWDVTDRKMAEEALKKAREAAEAASQAKSEFLANMSHEIRTPMNAIVGMTELVLDTPLNPEQRDYLEMVRKSADALMTVINDILDFSKIEAGRLDLDRMPFCVRDVVGDTLRSLAVSAHEKGLELACRITPEVPQAVIGDPHRLRQVLVNLVGNAIKFTERGEVVVQVEVRAGRGNEVALAFAVSDTGIGIRADKQRMIFEPFSQVDGSPTRRYGGTGLGLAISARLVEMLGGTLRVDSEEGRGSRFSFTAWFAVADASLAAPLGAPLGASVDPERVRGLSVLVVDDNATNRLILEETLSSWGMRPTTVAGGSEALEVLGQAAREGQPYELVLLDANMPGMDGFELAGRLRAEPGLARAAVMMLSSASGTSRPLLERVGIRAYLSKPVKQADLWRAMLDALGAAREGSAARNGRGGVRGAEARGRTAGQARPLRILLAEDHLFNQRLALGLLEKEGHRVTLARNGREAVAAAQREAFDAILMDVQMPEMDGLEATAEVRRLEVGTGRHVPILAMTAYAMKGDRERCLQAGMDGYLSKPIKAAELSAALAAVVEPRRPVARASALLPRESGVANCCGAAEAGAPADTGGRADEAGGLSAGGAAEVPDWTLALEYVGGDRQLLGEVLAIFLRESPAWLEQLRQALAAGDTKTAYRLVHNFKANLGNLGAVEAQERAKRAMEHLTKGDAGATEACRELEESVQRLRPALEAFGRGPGGPAGRAGTAV